MSEQEPTSSIAASASTANSNVLMDASARNKSDELISSSGAGLEAATTDAGDGACVSTSSRAGSNSNVLDSFEGSSSTVPVRPAYGNYHTVSGTDADVLRDVFNKKYRSSAIRSGDAKSKRGVRFISPNENITEEDSASEEKYRTRSDSRTLKDLFMRKRNKSGPVANSANQVTSLPDAKPKATRVWTFFDSFRSRPRSVSVCEDTRPTASAALTLPRPSVPAIAATATVGKKKKFKVTPAAVAQTSKQRGDQRRVSPEDFVEMFRTRTSSDPRNVTFQRSLAVASMRKKVLLQSASAAASEAKFERRKSDPSIHQELVNLKASNYATVTGSTAAKLSNYQKLSSHSSFNEGKDSRPFEPVHVVIWKDKRKGTRVFALPNEEAEYLGSGGEDQLYIRFMQSRCCYEAMPYSTKLVVFDTQLNVKKAFYALLQNGVRAAALWDTKRQDVTGMLTITDFIQILQKYYKSSQECIDEVETQRIATWRDMLNEDKRPLVSVSPTDSLLEAVERLYNAKVHRLLVINPQNGNPLHVLTYKRILRFVHTCMRNLTQPSFMSKTLEELKLGTYDDIAVAGMDTALIEVLNTFTNRRVSALPIINSEGRVIDIYSKFDAIDLAHEKSYKNMDITIGEAIKGRRENFEGVHLCKKTDNLFTVIEKIVDQDIHRLVIINTDRRVEGMLSLSDVLHFLIISPLVSSKAASVVEVASTEDSESSNQELSDEAALSSREEPNEQKSVECQSVKSSRDLLEGGIPLTVVAS